MDLLMEALEKTGYVEKVKLAMDVAASEFHLSHDQLAEEAAIQASSSKI